MAQIAQTTDFRVRKGLVVENTATILSTIGTTGTNSGALQVTGGVGIGGGLFVGGVITATTYYGVFAGSFAGTINTSTNLGAGVANQIPYQSAPGATTYSSNLVFNGTTFTTTNITVTGVAGTIGTNTGALQVVGGVGVAGGLFVGGTVTSTNHIITGVTNATSTTTGALQVVGGTGVGGNLYVGGDINVTNGQLILNGRDTVDGSLRSQVQISSTGTYTNAPVSGIEFSTQYAPGAGAGLGGISVGKLNTASGDYSSYLSLHTRVNGSGVAERFRIDSTGSVIVFATVPSNSTSTGALQVAGGVGIGGNLFVGGTITATNLVLTGNETEAGVLSITNVTGTTGTNTGALQVVGGVGIGGNLFVGGVITATTFVGNLTGIAVTATNANNIIGGAAGSIPIQSAAGTTAFIPLGNTGYVLTAAAGNTATWQALSGLAAGTATNAINVQTQAQPVGGTYYPTFVNANNINSAFVTEYTTSTLSINPATGILTVGSVAVTTSGTFGTAASNTVVAGIYSNNSVYASFTSNAISSSAQVNLDNYSSTVFRTAKYVVQIVDGTKVHVAEYLLFHDGTYVYLTPYAVSSNTGELGTFDAQISGGTVTLLFTPNYTPSSMIIKVVRTGITA